MTLLTKETPLSLLSFTQEFQEGKDMAYIYKITNKINQKVYIGKTQYSIESRFREHLDSSKRARCEKRPLYDAMNKYGIENFSIELVEETNNPEEREKYWINYYRSYIGFSDCNGYNATLGGDGKAYADREAIVQLYREGKNQREISKILGYDWKTIRVALREVGITHEEIVNNGLAKYKKAIWMVDKKTLEKKQLFTSISEAEKFLEKPRSKQHITEVCNGLRNSAYGYKWEWADN